MSWSRHWCSGWCCRCRYFCGGWLGWNKSCWKIWIYFTKLSRPTIIAETVFFIIYRKQQRVYLKYITYYLLHLSNLNGIKITYPQRHICRHVNRAEESMDHLKGKVWVIKKLIKWLRKLIFVICFWIMHLLANSTVIPYPIFFTFTYGITISIYSTISSVCTFCNSIWLANT